MADNAYVLNLFAPTCPSERDEHDNTSILNFIKRDTFSPDALFTSEIFDYS